ncbi:MAG: four helix bundle protein [Patescibacteria group bacterium]|nr:four helix bundle protein [Patescibacteria group bacterium]
MLHKITSAYKLWHEYLPHIPKASRYTLAARIDALLIATIEHTVTACFLPKTEKLPEVKHAITALDTGKCLLLLAWEIHALDEKKYIALSAPLAEAGRMLGGWHNQLIKQNSSVREEK